MTREQALPYVSYVVDDSGNGRRLGSGPHAIIRDGSAHKYPSILVGWQCGFEPMFVAVHSYLDVRHDDDEAAEIAKDYLVGRGWFDGEPTEPDYIIR